MQSPSDFDGKVRNLRPRTFCLRPEIRFQTVGGPPSQHPFDSQHPFLRHHCKLGGGFRLDPLHQCLPEAEVR